MKIALALCFVALVGLSAGDVGAPKSVAGRIIEQIPYKLMEWTAGFFMGMRKSEHYTATLQIYNLELLGGVNSFYSSNTYQLIRSFVGCESGISNGVNTIFTIIDLGTSDGWSWQIIVFGILYLYAWYQQNSGALEYYCQQFISLV